ncbi:MAG: M23 family metallopeptidase, partial [Pseudomonadota bacterium]|nr:M23 family metallopeptidase [Pseudomonadota bacterium]
MRMARVSRLAILAFLAVLSGGVAAQAQESAFQLVLPIACDIGRTCLVQHLVDRDPGPGARDYMCGTLTNDGHDGVDFRLPSLAAMRAGVDVLAAADGTVAAIRDGTPDRSVRETGLEAVAGTECGNGVRITHGNGWETQYCHMAQGSIQVSPGDPVLAGATIGRVGLSGQTEFPHLHLTVRRDGEVIDPFAAEGDDQSCDDRR